MRYDLYAVIGREFCRDKDLDSMVSEAIEGGADVVQLREKDITVEEYIRLGKKIREITRRAGVGFIINDCVDVAAAVDADGVHLGQDDTPISMARKIMGYDRIIGISAHNLSQALEAQEAGADYLGVGPVFPTPSKDDASAPIGIPALREICDRVTIPVVAIGGINAGNAEEVLKAGASGVAVISAIFGAGDIIRAAAELKKRISIIKYPEAGNE